MPKFFVKNEQIKENEITINGEDVNHIKKVLRAKIGDELQICNSQNGENFLCDIQSLDNEKINCIIKQNLEISTESNIKVTIFQGLPKADKMEYIIQKSVELGVYNIVPVDMKFCVAKLNNEEKKLSRWQTISEAAAKQSKRNIIPKIENKISFKNMLGILNEFDLVIIAYENENKTNLKEILQENKNINNIAIIIGPEGGLAQDEVEQLIENGAKSASIGKRILRTETASLAMLSMIMYEFEF